ncbi:serine/threonine-protein kinase [Spirosoma foliorum]|uniref:non-specific serine/threonine protein kinase n=1 Tax=Spirosoma foliorum TaxID=2710596 RepID=A0A7G5GZ98_9BACT|nr:serine/threonine-protein kinase [Spirosoma foliorum]QMW04190.1 serine/threonine protein kinase [Spirosoma foliorum]
MPTVSVNTHFPGYEIIGELGRSNARVLKARHLATGELVAIKHFALNTDAETLRRFRLESQLMTDIRHPNVVRVREVQLDMPMPFIVMDWIEGGNLRTLLAEREYLDVPVSIRLGQQMAEAFKAIHSRGIIHRDIKPENILFRVLPSEEIHFLLTDFGVARLREQSQTMTGQSLMTYEYASPEQFDNPRGVDVATDYYSLGVVLYESLSGRVPFSMTDSSGMATFMNQVLRTSPPELQLPSGQYLPPSLNTLLDWMLVKNPAERLSDVNELVLLLGQANVEQLQASRSGGRRAPVSARTVAAPIAAPQTPRPVPSQPIYEEEPANSLTKWNIGLASLLVALLIGLAVIYTNRQKNKVSSTITPDSTQMITDSSTATEVAADTTSTWSDHSSRSSEDSDEIEDHSETTTEPVPPISMPDSSGVVEDTTRIP